MDYDLLARVSNAQGISGFETDIQSVVGDVFAGCCDETRHDRLGNVTGIRRASSAHAGLGRPLRVALAAHSDEIGMMVKHVSPEGYIRFEPVGGLHAPTITSQHVTIFGREPVRGVIVPNFTMPSDVPALHDLVIDVGRPAQEVAELISVGDPISFVGELTRLNEDVVTGRNFDDRIGTYCLLEVMRRLGDTAVDVYAVSTVQEEVGVRGAHVAAYRIDPDIGVAIDGSVTKGPVPEPNGPTCDMGGGAGIYMMDKLTIGDPRLVRFLLDVGRRFRIPVQREVGGGTDASAMQRSRAGAISTTVGAPVRYMHSTVQLCHVSDIEATIALLTKFLEHVHEMLPASQWKAFDE